MPKKPVHFGIKVWATVDALLKHLRSFDVYCGKCGNPYDEGSGLDSEGREGM
jgi:hypothetical protein